MKPVRLAVSLAALLLLFVGPAGAAASVSTPEVIEPASPRDTFHFSDVTLTDGDQVFEHAEIYVRVKETSGGYTRADYVDASGRRLGFFEAFEVVSTDEATLRAWAIRNFGDRTQG